MNHTPSHELFAELPLFLRPAAAIQQVWAAEADTCVSSRGTTSNRCAPSYVRKDPLLTLCADQIPDALKNDVPDHVKERAREMARLELARRLEELNMSPGEAKGYGALFAAVEGHIASLHDLLESASSLLDPDGGVGILTSDTCRSCGARGRADLGEAADGRRAGRWSAHRGPDWRGDGLQATGDGEA